MTAGPDGRQDVGSAGHADDGDQDEDRPIEAVGRRVPVAKIAAVVIGVVMLTFVVVLATRPAANSRFIKNNVLGRQVPDADVPLQTLDGRTIRLSDYRGRTVLLNFFASWCVPCQNEQPVLKDLQQRLGAAGQLTIIGVVFSDQPAAASTFLQAGGATWPAVVDPKGQFALDFGVRQPPENYLVDADGTVRGQFYELSPGALDNALRSL
jgi:cytochrome c biogenesis protein CcmG/thiol:disulfide interchange protein DsbE